MNNQVIQGDCLEVMKMIPDNSVDSVVCDPPYGLSFMGKHWDYDVPTVDVWRECLRVLKPGGHLLSFAGTRTQHRMAVNIEDAGFEIRDMIAWIYGCLSEDTEILTEMGYKPLHKTTQYDRIMVYDIQKNIYQWERPQGWQVYRVHEDTAYRIQSDYTDQIVSRNHNCLVERDGKLVFKKSEELSEMEYMPVLSEDFYTLQKGYGELLLSKLLRKSKGLAQTLLGKWKREKTTRKGTGDGKKPSVERWSNLFQKERKLRKIQNQVCEMSKGISADGEERWVCNGASFDSSSIVGEMFRENPSSASYQSQSRGQQNREPDVVSIKQGTQDTRVARVTKIKYSGLIFCPTVSTGAFVARRNGKVFITGNSGFPKSLNIGKAVDKLQGNEREKFERDNGSATSIEGKKTIYGSGENKSENGTRRFIDTKGTSEWEGWGTALKPSWESITVAQKQLDSSSIDMIELVHIIKKTLCLSQSNASTVERILRSNHSEQNEEVNIAQWIAEKNINILEDLSVLMDMLQLESEKNSNWNIVLLWLNILGEIYKQTNISTTSTELNTTIELKTLLSMEWENIFQNIIQAKNSQTNGLSANVWNAESIFNALRLKLKTIQELSVQENATLKEKEITFAPNLSPIIMSRKPLAEKTVAENCLKWGVGGINIDESRVEYQGKEDFENTLKSNTGNIAGGTFKCSSKSMAKEEVITQLGRFPANLIHDGSQEVLEGFPQSGKGNGGSVYSYKGKEYDNKDTSMFNGDKPQAPSNFNDSGSAARFFYCAKSSKRDRNEGCEGLEEKEYTMNSSPKRQVVDGVQQDVNFTTKPLTNKNNHPTVKPTDLMRYLCRLVTPKGGTVLDPFMGSGSTGKAAKLEGFDFIGIEREAEYVKIAEARINAVKPESKLL